MYTLWIFLLLFVVIFTFVSGSHEIGHNKIINELLRKQIKKIGQGAYGEVFLTKFKHDTVVVKVEQIHPILSNSLFYNYNKEIEFNREIAKLPVAQRRHFMKLYMYDFLRTPKITYIRWVYSAVDDVLANKYSDMCKNPVCIRQLYNQFMHICSLLKRMHYHHTDIHFNNIGLNFTSEKKLARGEFTLVLIDYGLVLHERYKPFLPQERIDNYESRFDTDCVIFFTYDDAKMIARFDELVANKLLQPFNYSVYTNKCLELIRDPFFDVLHKLYGKYASSFKRIIFSYCMYFHTEITMKIVMQEFYEPKYTPHLTLDQETVIAIYKNLLNTKHRI
jgi:serine/threonine protein kinase